MNMDLCRWNDGTKVGGTNEGGEAPPYKSEQPVQK